MLSDIEIAHKCKMKDIGEIAAELGLKEKDIERYGRYKAKIAALPNGKKRGKLILVTAINPTASGEGKTTVSIGLADGMHKGGKKVCLALREPSLGPVFGIKGGAAGGGYAQVVPMEDINLHFTGDLHAITAANNLLAAMLDNHIFRGNALDIDPEKIYFRRCLDMNDRALRNVTVGQRGEGVEREEHFEITAASEVMAILCLATSLKDLKRRLGNIIVGENRKGEYVYARDLKAEGSMCALLKDAIKPNLVQTLEGTPAIVHGGPFANIAHGCNSILATYTALSLADWVVTDKLHGGADKASLSEENLPALRAGMPNLYKHIENIRNVYNLPVVVAMNRFASDTPAEIETVMRGVEEAGAKAVFTDVFLKGGEGGRELAEAVCAAAEERGMRYAYDLNDPVEKKIEDVVRKVYGGAGVTFSAVAEEKIADAEKRGYGKLPVIIAKTQYSLSDDAKLLARPEGFTVHVRDVIVKGGAGFIVAVAGNIMLMPGLGKVPAAEHIDVDENGEIVGLS